MHDDDLAAVQLGFALVRFRSVWFAIYLFITLAANCQRAAAISWPAPWGCFNYRIVRIVFSSPLFQLSPLSFPLSHSGALGDLCARLNNAN